MTEQNLLNKLITKESLTAPISYWNSKPSLNNNTDYCGADDFTAPIVPESLLGIDVREACHIHDYMYVNGMNQNYRKKADKVFWNNLKTLVNEKSGSFLTKALRKAKAYLYYLAVRLFGRFYYSPETN